MAWWRGADARAPGLVEAARCRRRGSRKDIRLALQAPARWLRGAMRSPALASAGSLSYPPAGTALCIRSYTSAARKRIIEANAEKTRGLTWIPLMSARKDEQLSDDSGIKLLKQKVLDSNLLSNIKPTTLKGKDWLLARKGLIVNC